MKNGCSYIIFKRDFFFILQQIKCKSYNFIITKVEITPTHTLEVFNNNEKIAFWNYIISENEGVEIGDLIYKKKCSKYLYIYKKNEMGKYEEHLKVNLSNLFPIEWFCNN